MTSARNRRHIVVPSAPIHELYSPHPRYMKSTPVPVPPSRQQHGMALIVAINDAESAGRNRRDESGIQVHGTIPGTYVQFESQPDVPLKLESLEDKRRGIEVAAVSYFNTSEVVPRRVERATVFVPDGKVGHFIERFEAYAQGEPKAKGEKRHENMIDRVADLRLATLRGFWTDSPDVYPIEEEEVWWEVWLRRHDGNELQRLMEFAGIAGLEVGDRRLQFDDRIVTLVRATSRELSASIDVINDMAELRLAKETAAVFIDMDANDQTDFANDLAQRTYGPGEDSPVICVLDTGVNNGHLLLKSFLDNSDCHSCDTVWRVGDHDGHGTRMAGLALYGDLGPLLAGSQPVRVYNRLESVKILPPPSENPTPPELYGTVTAIATGLVEIQAPSRNRCFAMAVTASDERDRGQPTSWSASIDALASG